MMRNRRRIAKTKRHQTSSVAGGAVRASDTAFRVQIVTLLVLCYWIHHVEPFCLSKTHSAEETGRLPRIHHDLTFISINRKSSRRLRRRRSTRSACSLYSQRNDDDDDDGYMLSDQVDYGKFEIASSKEDEYADGAPFRLLPDFVDDDDDDDDDSPQHSLTSSSWSSSSPSPERRSSVPPDDMQRRIEEQQRQIDMLMQLVQSQTPSQQQQTTASDEQPTPPFQPPTAFSSTTAPPPAVAPLKAMLFIDGTWLYYSIHERQESRCPIAQKYGLGWQTRYSFDWAALPRIICEQMQQQQVSQGWSSSTTTTTTPDSSAKSSPQQQQQQSSTIIARPVEVVRASVFTSVKKDTSKYSNRLRMFEDMNNCNYDVHMMETVGAGEKCVDIQLAVEMLHYATVHNAYDVAILISGDKDFLPALIRTRQKGRQVCIVSMRTSCNRALYETPNVKDYEPIWIEDFLDQLMIAKKPTGVDGVEGHLSMVSVFTLMKVIYDFIDKSGQDMVSSRDIGRYLKGIKIGGQSMLDEVKKTYGGLFQFLSVCGCFNVLRRQPRDDVVSRRLAPDDKAFWATLHPTAEQVLLAEAQRTQFSEEEKDFFDSYTTQSLDDGNFQYSVARRPHTDSSHRRSFEAREKPLELPEELTRDYSKLKVAELKEICRERGLHISGTKAVLLERIEGDVAQEVEELKKQHKERVSMKRPRISSRISGDGYARLQIPPQSSTKESTEYLEGLIREYIQASGGEASSRDVGRYLAANAGSHRSDQMTALAELKSSFGGLSAFLAHHQDKFTRTDAVAEDGENYEFRIALQKQ